jgi:PII-like signaling protein
MLRAAGGRPMKLEGEQVLLRVFLDSFQKWHFRPLFEVIVDRARHGGLAGATVLRGLKGFGMSGVILQERRWALANDHELVVEVIDTREKIDAFLAEIEPMLHNVIVTTERAHVVLYRGEPQEGSPQ